MRTFFVPVAEHFVKGLLTFKNINFLHSYFYAKTLPEDFSTIIKKNNITFFLDSGAHSVNTINAEIKIQEYISFIKKYKDCIKFYAGLDDIKDYKKTISNQKIMEAAGLKPLITYHYNEPIELLNDYLNQYDMICLGGVVGKGRNAKIKWLNNLYDKIIGKYPLKKIHMFGISDKKILSMFPFYSADSSKHSIQCAMGYSQYGINNKPNKSLNFIKHLKLTGNSNTETSMIRFIDSIKSAIMVEKYITDLWTKRGVTWDD